LILIGAFVAEISSILFIIRASQNGGAFVAFEAILVIMIVPNLEVFSNEMFSASMAIIVEFVEIAFFAVWVSVLFVEFVVFELAVAFSAFEAIFMPIMSHCNNFGVLQFVSTSMAM